MNRTQRVGLTLSEAHGSPWGRSLLNLWIVMLIVYLGVQAQVRTKETDRLLRAQAQVAAIFRDVMSRLQAAPAMGQVVFVHNSGTLTEYVDLGTGWRPVQPESEISLTLPDGVFVSSWTFPTNAMRAWISREGGLTAWPGRITLAAPHGGIAEVMVKRNGTVWY